MPDDLLIDLMNPPTVYAALAALPLVSTEVTADTFRLMTLFLTNVGAVNRTVTVTNAAGVVLVKMVVPALTPLPALSFGLMQMEGLSWFADGAGINGQVEGFPIA